MAKFMVRARYTAAGATGLLKEGGTSRMGAIERLVGSVGGSVESVYWALGEDDVFIVADLPDAKAAAAVSLTVGASGAVSITTSPLLTAADVDEIVRRHVEYRAPGT